MNVPALETNLGVKMSKTRLEAFSDGVLAIVITIMVLELKVVHGEHLSDLAPRIPVFLSYVMSFTYVAIYWNNHHHLFHAVKHISGKVLWANMHLLFWLSLIPFVTAWMGENHFAAAPVGLYGIALLLPAISYYVLVRALLAAQEKSSPLHIAIGSDFKGRISVVIYVVAILLAFFVSSLAAGLLYAAVALLWLVPDKRIERVLSH